MKLETAVILSVPLFFIFLGCPRPAFSQETDLQKEQPSSVRDAFQEAIKNLESEREAKDKELILKLQARLGRASAEWVVSQKEQKLYELNKLLRQSWEKLSRTLNISPIHYEYYLREYDYSIGKNDIIRTESILAPYKAYVNFTENIYVEREHSRSVSYREQYFYTVATPIKVTFEHIGDKFKVINTEWGQISFTEGVPEAIEARILRQAFD